MKFVKWLQNKHTIWILCFVANIVLFVSYLKGFFSYDFFTLWGVHPKTVWTLKNIFLTGQDTVLNFKYHSILGNIFGGLMILLSPTSYPDWGWGLFITCINYFLLAYIVFKSLNRTQTLMALTLILLFIPGTVLRQQMFGGYLDITGVLLFILGIIFFDEHKFYKAASLFTLMILVKPTLWPWVVIMMASDFLSALKDGLRIKKFLPVLVFCILGLLLLKFWYYTPSIEQSLVFYDPKINHLDLKTVIKLILTPFTVFTGMLTVLTVLIWRERLTSKRELMFIGFGLLKVWLIYLILITPSESEVFPSIKRYLIMLIVPIAYAYSQRVNTKKFLPFGVGLLVVLILVRSGELSSTLKNVDDITFNICGKHSTICNQELNFVEREKGCQIEILDPESMKSKFNNAQIEFLIFHYIKLPEMLVYDSGNRVSLRVENASCN